MGRAGQIWDGFFATASKRRSGFEMRVKKPDRETDRHQKTLEVDRVG